MPVLFVASALSTGLSVTALTAHFLEKEGSTDATEGKVHLALVIVEIVIVAIFFGMMAAGAKGPVGAESASLVIYGKYAIVFWGYFIALGLLLPLVVFGLEYQRAKQPGRQVVTEPASLGTEITTTAEGSQQSYLVLVTDLAVLVGGFALRALVIFAALPIWDGKLL